jgi:hypothetical protein
MYIYSRRYFDTNHNLSDLNFGVNINLSKLNTLSIYLNILIHIRFSPIVRFVYTYIEYGISSDTILESHINLRSWRSVCVILFQL